MDCQLVDAEPGAERNPSERLSFAVLGTVQSTLIFSITLLVVPLPKIGREFGLHMSQLVILSIAYGLPFSGLLLFGGRLADAFGGLRIFLAGTVAFGVGSIGALIAPGFGALTAARATQGMGAALVAPAALALLREVIPDRDRYRQATATWGGLSVVGATAGTVLSGVVTTWLSWRWMFTVPLAVAGGALVLTPRLLPAPSRPTRNRLDVPGAASATSGICLASYGLAMTAAHSWTAPTVLAPVIAGLLLLSVFVFREAHTGDALLPLPFLADRRRAVALAAVGLTAAGTSVVFLYLTLYLQQIRGWSTLRTSLAFLPYAITLILSGRLAANGLNRWSPRTILAIGLVLAATGLALLARIHTSIGYAAGLLPGTMLLPAGAALCFAAAGVRTLDGVPQHRSGLASGVMNTAMELGPTVGLTLLSAVAAGRTHSRLSAGFDRAGAVTNGYAWAFGTTAICFAVLAVSAILITKR